MGKIFIDDNYTYKGYRLVIIENNYFKVTILPEKGADIYEFIDKKSNIDYLWKTPMGLKSSVRSVPAGYGNESNFSNTYEGGWQVVFPNGGSSCLYKGINLEMCGDALAQRWNYRIIENGPDNIEIILETVLNRLPYKLKRIIKADKDKPELRIKEEIKNCGYEELEYMWGQHVAFEGKLIRDSCWELIIPCKKVFTNTSSLKKNTKPPAGNRINRFPQDGEYVWPNAKDKNNCDVNLAVIPDKNIKSCDILYLTGFSEGKYFLTNESKNLGFSLMWDKKQFPYLWYYQNFNGSFGYPWYGRGNGIVLEPITSFPALGLNEAILRDNHNTIKAGGTVSTELTAKLINV